MHDILKVHIPLITFKVQFINIQTLQDSHDIQKLFCKEKQPALYLAILAIEDLLSSWEEKVGNIKFDGFADALEDSIAKICKYYCQFDEKPNMILALSKCCVLITEGVGTNQLAVLHPYYAFEYIESAWGGKEKQLQEVKNRNKDAKNWQDKVRKVVGAMVTL